MKIIRIVSLAALGLLNLTATHAQNNVAAPKVPLWMSPEVGNAWAAGYKGSGVTVTVVDDFRNPQQIMYDFNGVGGPVSGPITLDGVTTFPRRGGVTLKMASMIAPAATMRSRDYHLSPIAGLSSGLNVLSVMNYSVNAPAGYTASKISLTAQESTIASYAKNGKAVIVKAAGNDSVAIGSANATGKVDYLNLALKGAQSAIYVGTLKTDGTTGHMVPLVQKSNTPGADATFQRQFLVVVQDSRFTDLPGTEYAAPIISGYAAILGSKFTKASPTQIANQLLNTARQDTIYFKSYATKFNAAKHGRGEASITRALAPVSLK